MDHATDTAPANVEKVTPAAEHTPGPWSVFGRAVQLGTDRFVTSSNDGYPISAADARLIAAAPDLLEAAELALATAESWIHDQLDGTSGLEAELEKLEPVHAAIAKARGIPPDP